MAHNYEEFPFPQFRHAIKNGKNEYRNKFFHDIDLGFLLKWMENIEGENYTIRIVNNKLQLINAEGEVVSEVDLAQGQVGPQGPAGPVGPKGDKGDTGSQGPQGPKGATGDVGPQGIQGIQGVKGDKGDTGSQGPQGPTGPKGDIGPQGPQGIQGPKGDKGDTGDGFHILGDYDSYAALVAAHPTGHAGDAWQVGTPTSDYYNKSEIDAKIPLTGTVGNVLTKTASGSEWAPPTGGGGGDDYLVNLLRICRDYQGTVNISGMSIHFARYIQNKISGSWYTDYNSRVIVTQNYSDRAEVSAVLGTTVATWSAPQPTDPDATEARWILSGFAVITLYYDTTTFVGWNDTTNLLKDKTIIPIYQNPFAKSANCLLYDDTTGEALNMSRYTLYKDSANNCIIMQFGEDSEVLPDTGMVKVPDQYRSINIITN